MLVFVEARMGRFVENGRFTSFEIDEADSNRLVRAMCSKAHLAIGARLMGGCSRRSRASLRTLEEMFASEF